MDELGREIVVADRAAIVAELARAYTPMNGSRGR